MKLWSLCGDGLAQGHGENLEDSARSMELLLRRESFTTFHDASHSARRLPPGSRGPWRSLCSISEEVSRAADALDREEEIDSRTKMDDTKTTAGSERGIERRGIQRYG